MTLTFLFFGISALIGATTDETRITSAKKAQSEAAQLLLACREGGTKRAQSTCTERFFGIDTMARHCLENQKAALGRVHYEKTLKALTELLGLRVKGASQLLAKAQLSETAKVGQNPYAVEFVLRDGDANQEKKTFSLVWGQAHKGHFRVVDVCFDGASVINDYRNQFARLLKKNGPDALAGKIEEQLQKMRVSP